MSTLCPHCGAHHGFGAAQLEGHGTMKSDPNIQRIADLERQLAEAKAELGELKMEIEAVNGAADYQTRIAAEAKAEIEAMRPMVERLYYAESYLEEAVTDADIQTGIKHAAGLLEDIRGTIREYESRKQP